MRALAEACAVPGFPAEPVVVIADRPDAAGLEVAHGLGLETAVVDRREHSTRESFDAALDDMITARGADLVCLAGFMRLLGPDFVARWRDRLVNIHPSLLPAFKGLDTHARVLAAGVRFTGCTVHFVRPELDAGPIIVQAKVPVLPGDDAASLAQRVLEEEHRIYPLAVRRIAEGRVHVEGEAVVVDGAATLLAPKLAAAHLQGGAMRSPNAPVGAYRARDGWIAVTLVRESHFAGLCRVLGRPELAADPRFDTGEKRAGREAELREIAAAALTQRTRAEWLEAFGAARVLSNPINDPAYWLADPHVLAADAVPLLEQAGVDPVPRVLEEEHRIYPLAVRRIAEGRVHVEGEAVVVDGAATLLAPKLAAAHLQGGAMRSPNAPVGAYRARDGWIAVTLVRESHFAGLCRVLGRPELAVDPRFDTGEKRAAREAELREIVAAVLARRTRAEWLEAFGATGVLSNPVNDPTDWLADPHVLAADAAPLLEQAGVGPVPVPRVPGLPDAAHANLAAGAPRIGEHGVDVLAEIGYRPEEIAEMRDCGALAGPPDTTE